MESLLPWSPAFGFLGPRISVPIPLPLHLLPEDLDLLAFRAIFMSQAPSPSSIAEEEIELAVQFEGLSISVRGPVNTSLDFVRRLSGSSPGAPSLSASHEVSRASTSSAAAAETRASIEASFDPCPARVLVLSSRLHQSSTRLGPTERIQRAWKAGQWAGAVRQGRVSSPNRTPTIDLPNKYYVVVRSPNHRQPAVYHSRREYFAALGRLESSDSISHGFPSEAEARAYLAGAGEDYPSSSN